MAADANDVFMEVGSPGTATTLSSPGYTSGVSTSINVASTTNWPTTTGVIFAIDEVTTVDGEEVRVEGTYNEFEGTVASATQITNVDYVEGDAERSYSAGSSTRVYIPVSAERENRLAQGMAVEHSQLDGTHTDVTADTIAVSGVSSLSDHIDVVDAKSIRDGNNNELVTFSQTASAINEITVKNAATANAPQVQATGGDTNIDLSLVPKGTGEVTKAGNPIDWWEEIGRTTLGVAGDTISVQNLPARKYLCILAHTVSTGGTNTLAIRFNNDSGANYAVRNSSNGAADTTAVSQSSTTVAPGVVALPGWAVIQVENVAAQEKLAIFNGTRTGTAGAGNAPDRLEGVFKWANTSDQISRVDAINGGSGDFAIGSEVVVLGHD